MEKRGGGAYNRDFIAIMSESNNEKKYISMKDIYLYKFVPDIFIKLYKISLQRNRYTCKMPLKRKGNN